MSKGKYIALTVGVVTAVTVCVGSVVWLLHNRNSQVVEKDTTAVTTTEEQPTEAVTEIEATLPETPILPNRESELFTEQLSSYVGSVVVSTYMDTGYLNEALTAIKGIMDADTALYLYTVSFDRDTGDVVLSYYYYNGEFGEGEVVLPEVAEETSYRLVYEEYQGQITVIK